MSDTDDGPDITSDWTLRRGTTRLDRTSRFHLDISIDARFVEPTRDEIRTTLAQILDEALGVDTTAPEIAGWADNLPPVRDDNLPRVRDPGPADEWGGSPMPSTEVFAENERLRAWKAEATQLIDILEECHNLLPPERWAPLGHSKAEAVRLYLQELA